MATTASKTSKRKWPAIVLAVLTLLLLLFVIRQLDRAPRTDDAYVYADTIDVVPEVGGRISRAEPALRARCWASCARTLRRSTKRS